MRPAAVAVAVVAFTACCALGWYGYRRGGRYLNQCKPTTKQSRREMLRSKRRSRKDERLKAKKLTRSEALAAERAAMTQEQKNEQRERIRMQRVEQYQKLEQARLNGVRVVVDLAFAAQQTTRECNSIFKQLGCAYGYLKTCPLDNLVSMELASCTQELTAVSTHGVSSWKIKKHEESFEQLYSTDRIVYLSPESDHVLERLEQECVYIVGGIVDRSVRKDETMSKATALGVRSARLPLHKYLDRSDRCVRTHIMNLDTVIIILNEVANHGDWRRAFERAVPQRIARNKQIA